MTRKDTILIAVVINAGLLSILFITALIYDTDAATDQVEFASLATDHKEVVNKMPSSNTEYASTGKDEVDQVLELYSQPNSQVLAMETGVEFSPEPIIISPAIEETAEFALPSNEQFIEIRVKKGDVLSKIAQANGTSSAEIKALNHLQSERLSIGQVLKIPMAKSTHVSRVAEKTATDSPNAVYYVVRQGDNPWKIAKQFNVKFEEILKLNNLNEEKARNMKIGDRIRVK